MKKNKLPETVLYKTHDSTLRKKIIGRNLLNISLVDTSNKIIQIEKLFPPNNTELLLLKCSPFNCDNCIDSILDSLDIFEQETKKGKNIIILYASDNSIDSHLFIENFNPKYPVYTSSNIESLFDDEQLNSTPYFILAAKARDGYLVKNIYRTLYNYPTINDSAFNKLKNDFFK